MEFPAATAAAIILLLMAGGAAPQSVSQCANVLITMSSCLNYVGGSADAPPASCCSALANVVNTQPRCLCLIVNGDGGSLGVTINRTRALDMPKACNVETPPTSRCNEGGGPAMAPAGSPEGSPEKGGSKTTSNGSTRRVINYGVFAANILIIVFFLTTKITPPAMP
ncbi:non-specific lipid transfer protein GPI-anchored 5-like [Andrographis paniculata]|uniref:non-specific lipid transfer protein GPI-anchored 5-like n=1 Tax=Andrographis paniculata TaxID=175694 RepID=UPI0021E8F924|nr:non-specific lipid transfer protein GPI-anchored 5-like [Andrographis paniculata]